MIRIATAATLLAVLTGCASSATDQPAGSPASQSAGLRLIATLDSPTDVTLSWSGAPADATSTVVEFATEPEGRYTILDFVDADRLTFEHPDLMPKTPFYYRVTPVLGPASAALEVKLPAATIFRTASENPAAGSPTEVAAKSVGKDGVRLTWKDNSSDEDGYLLEIRPRGSTQYRVAGFVDPDSTFTELTTLPGERDASYRIRAFHRGPSSNLAHQTTGTD
ncbi:fibronectin type III domain-containing protein [Kribbella sp. CA-293567]|uniref:fibronectin type III domain-containing protein n=1 Tax=Kribbella sp. CA-293567 TaxID=3002436 RepID=UPI0022DD382E|nr:fibronectin type III domain-containing protein [Kribbella sp. CA-293567]WBQ03962.1 fibronectin type III domain-containing protein [Kribbella sp. CA-293567]